MSEFTRLYPIWTGASTRDFGNYRLEAQQRLRRACAYAQSRQSLQCSHKHIMDTDESSDQTSDR